MRLRLSIRLPAYCARVARFARSMAPCALGLYMGAGPQAQAQAQPTPTAQSLFAAAATALGGESAVRQVHTLQLYGYGEDILQDGGSSIANNPHAPRKRGGLDGIVRTIDFDHERMRLHEVHTQLFEYAFPYSMTHGNIIDQGLDGDNAFDTGGGGDGPNDAPPHRVSAMAARQRHIELLDNPLSIVRAGLSGAHLDHVRRAEGAWLVDMDIAPGDSVTMAFSPVTHLPVFMRWVAPQEVLGDVTYTTWFTGYEPLGNGLVMPFGYQTVVDYHDVVDNEVSVDKYVVNGLSDEQREALAAPAAVRAQPPAGPRAIIINALHVQPHVWYIHSSVNGSSTVFEFTDHLTVYEAYSSEQNFEAILAKIHELLPGKPVTQLIISHHHLDHTGGIRAAVGEGLTVITNRGENVDFVREVISRHASRFPDVLERKGRVGKVDVVPVDDRLVLKDANLEVDLLRVINNNHMADALLAYLPATHTVVEGDLMDDTGWDDSWWVASYPDTVKYWKLNVEWDIPVHGQIHTWTEVMELTKRQVSVAQDMCERADKAGFALPGCPFPNALDSY